MQRSKFPMSRVSYRTQQDSKFRERSPSDSNSDAEEKLYPDLKNISNDHLESSWNKSKSDPNLSNSDSPEKSFKNRRPVGAANNFNSDPFPKDFKKTYECPKRTPPSEFSFRWIYFFFLVIPVLCFYLKGIGNDEQNIFDKLREMFPKQPEETWSYYKTMMSDCLENDPSYPAVFVLLYVEQNKTVNDLVKALAEFSSQQLNNNKNYIEIEKDEFHTSEALNDYGYLIDKYREELFTRQVMVVKDLQDIPGKVAPVFHTFCDEITPLINRPVVYIFTVKVESLEGQEEIIVTNKLKASWYDLKNDVIIPLLARVTGTVLKVVKE